MGFAHMLATLAGAKAPPHGATGRPVRNNDDGVEPESLQCMEQLSAASPQQTGCMRALLQLYGAILCCGAAEGVHAVVLLHSGGRHSSCVSVMVLLLHAWLWRVVGKMGVNACMLARLGLRWRGQWVCDVGGQECVCAENVAELLFSLAYS